MSRAVRLFVVETLAEARPTVGACHCDCIHCIRGNCGSCWYGGHFLEVVR